ncbi:transmembrane protein 134 [Amia ocellicauda]|uniref:transmembrane protein 134 n=1 Tax=Amia ocellicauda TaxID=2972642 RepID=UPI0034639B09
MATQFSIDDAFSLDPEEEEEDEGEGVPGGGGGGGGEGADGTCRFGSLSFVRQSANVGPTNSSSASHCSNNNTPSTGQSEQCSLKYQNLENDDDGLSNCGNTTFNNLFRIREAGSVSLSQWSFSTLSSGTQLSYRECFSWTRHPLILKNRRVVVASFLLLITGLALIFTGVAIQVNPSAGVSSAIFFVPGFLLLIPGVYHVIFIYCAVRGRRGFRFFYLPYFEK